MWEFSAIALGGDVDPNGGLEALDVKGAVLPLELHEVQRGEVARRVVEEDVLGAGVGGMDGLGALAGVPLLDGSIVLEPRVTTDPGALGNEVEEAGGVLLLQGLVGGHGAGPPLLALHGGAHELVGDPDGQVLVLIHYGAIGLAIERAVVALLDERPRLLLLAHLGGDEVLDVAVPVAEGVHLGGAAGLAAGLHHVGHLVIDLEEGHRARRAAATGELLAGAANGREVRAGAGAELEEHGLRVGQGHDALHVVMDPLDEAGGALGILVLRGGALGLAQDAVVIPVSAAGVLADAVLVKQADVEPNGRVEGPVLVDAEPGQFLVEDLSVRLGEVPVFDAPVCDGTGDAVDELADGLLALGLGWIPVEVLGANDLGGELGP
jgi:hypothetical protein